jgi:hypothetical protein
VISRSISPAIAFLLQKGIGIMSPYRPPNEAGSFSIQKWLLYGDLFGILAPGTAVR